jgi:hypothetical protein
VFGAGFTAWNSIFFDCSNQEIRLRHSRYSGVEFPARGECNQGSVIAKSIGIYHQCYISQLTVTIEEEMINRTIECSAYNTVVNELTSTTIGQVSLAITGIPYPPPTNIHIESNDSHQITFAWDEATVQCSSLQYIITAINCGVCPNTTADKNATCDIQSDISPHTNINNTCLFAVQTEICGYLRGKRSDYVRVHIAHGKYNCNKNMYAHQVQMIYDQIQNQFPTLQDSN